MPKTNVKQTKVREFLTFARSLTPLEISNIIAQLELIKSDVDPHNPSGDNYEETQC